MPVALAIMAATQWVASAGGSLSVRAAHPLGHPRAERRDARWPRLVAQQTVVALLGEALLPTPDAGLRLAGPAHDPIGADANSAVQHDPCAPNMLLGDVAVPDERLQTTTVGRAQYDADSWAHEPDSHTESPAGIPPRDSNVRFYPLGVIALVIWGSEGASKDHLIIGGAILVFYMVTVPSVYLYKLVAVPAVVHGEQRERISKLEQQPDKIPELITAREKGEDIGYRLQNSNRDPEKLKEIYADVVEWTNKINRLLGNKNLQDLFGK